MTTLEHDDRARLRAAVLAQVARTQEGQLSTRGRVRRPGIIVALSVALVGIGVTSATAVVLHQRSIAAAPVASARCYGQVSSDRGDGFPGYTVVIGNPGLNMTSNAAKVIDPVPLCANLWEVGALPRTDNQVINQAAHAPVPNLTACVGTDGSVAVYPGDSSVCATLSMSIDTNSRPHIAK